MSLVLEQLLLAGVNGPRRGSLLRREVLAPGQHLHAKRLAQDGDPRTEFAEPQDSQRLARHTVPNRGLPLAGAHAVCLAHQVAGERKNQPPGKLRSGCRQRLGASHQHAALGSGVDIDGGITHARGDQQAQVGELLEQCARKGRALAHQHYRLKRLQAAGKPRQIDEVVVEKLDLGAGSKAVPIRQRVRYAAGSHPELPL